VLSVGETVVVEEVDCDSLSLSDGLAVELEVEDDVSLPLLVGLIVVLEVEDCDSLSLSDGLAVGLEVEDDVSLPLLVGLIVVLEAEDGDSLSLSDGLTVVLEVDEFVSLLALDLVVASAEPLVALAVVLEVLLAELDEVVAILGASGDQVWGFWGPLTSAGPHCWSSNDRLGVNDRKRRLGQDGILTLEDDSEAREAHVVICKLVIVTSDFP
jgi:hypothetical protein